MWFVEMITDGNYLKPLSSKAAQYLEVKLIVARSSTSSWVLSISQAYFHSHDWLSRQWYFVRLKDRSQELLVLPFVKNSILTVRKRRSRAIIKPTISTFLVLICPPPQLSQITLSSRPMVLESGGATSGVRSLFLERGSEIPSHQDEQVHSSNYFCNL